MNTQTINMFAETNEDMPLFSVAREEEPAQVTDPVVSSLDALNARLAGRGQDYRFAIKQPRKGIYHIVAVGSCWFWPPSYGKQGFKQERAIHAIDESIERFSH